VLETIVQPLVAVIAQGSLFSVAIGTNLVIDASQSRDLGDLNATLLFNWQCWTDKGETSVQLWDC
jgi:hypothetical protein